MKYFNFPKENGFSVVEIILACALFMILSAGSIAVILQGFDANRTATETIVANQYAIEGIEAVRSIRNQSYANLVATASAGLTRNASNTWTFFGTKNQFGPNSMYTRVISISTVYRDSISPSGNIVDHTTYPGGGTLDTNTMKATVTVTWNHSPTRINNVIQTTYFTNWRGVNAI